MIGDLLYYTVMAWCAAVLALLCTLVFGACLQLQRSRTRTRDLERCIRVEPERPMHRVPAIDVPALPIEGRIRVDCEPDAVQHLRREFLRLDQHSAITEGRTASARDISRCVHAMRPACCIEDDWRDFTTYRRN